MRISKTKRWRSLDNAAKIFPATSGKKDSRVFRFACELYDPVDPPLLQQALVLTLDRFPMFRSVIRKGIFWYYFEDSDLEPIVREEYRLPCSHLYIKDKKTLLFEVTYYKKRINFEVFHALTDGTGAMHFLKHLVCQYLLLRYFDQTTPKPLLPSYDATDEERAGDSFRQYYTKNRKQASKNRVHAYQLHGYKNEYGHMQILEGCVSVKKILAKAKEYHTSLTVFLTALLISAIHQDVSRRQEKKPIVLMIPVNLRNYFPSESARNFFGWINAGYTFAGMETFEDVIRNLDTVFKHELTSENISLRMNDLAALEHNVFLRLLPLALKDLGMRIAAKASTSSTTAILSNLGVLHVPEEFSPYIRLFDVFTSTPKLELCVCSFQDVLTLSFTSCFESSTVQRNFFRMLSGHGIDVEIAAKQDRRK